MPPTPHSQHGGVVSLANDVEGAKLAFAGLYFGVYSYCKARLVPGWTVAFGSGRTGRDGTVSSPLLGDGAQVLRGHGVSGPEFGVEGAAGPGAHNIHLQAIESL